MYTKPDMCTTMVEEDAKAEALELFLISPIAYRLLRSEGYGMKSDTQRPCGRAW